MSILKTKKQFDLSRADTDLFSWTDEIPRVVYTFSSTSCLTGSLLSGVVDADLNILTRAKSVKVELESFATASVDKGHLEDIIRAGKWKPDTQNNRLKKWAQRRLCFPGTKPRLICPTASRLGLYVN
jgi:hypothetical protein